MHNDISSNDIVRLVASLALVYLIFSGNRLSSLDKETKRPRDWGGNGGYIESTITGVCEGPHAMPSAAMHSRFIIDQTAEEAIQ